MHAETNHRHNGQDRDVPGCDRGGWLVSPGLINSGGKRQQVQDTRGDHSSRVSILVDAEALIIAAEQETDTVVKLVLLTVARELVRQSLRPENP